jgi:hypothetical protein
MISLVLAVLTCTISSQDILRLKEHMQTNVKFPNHAHNRLGQSVGAVMLSKTVPNWKNHSCVCVCVYHLLRH